jgi:hypothetical protein
VTSSSLPLNVKTSSKDPMGPRCRVLKVNPATSMVSRLLQSGTGEVVVLESLGPGALLFAIAVPWRSNGGA